MSEDKNKNPGCSSCIGCLSVFFSLISAVSIFCLIFFMWKYFTGRMIMWCDESTGETIAHYSDGHLARCEACFKGVDSDDAVSWAGAKCVPIVEMVGNFTPIDSEDDSTSDTGI